VRDAAGSMTAAGDRGHGLSRSDRNDKHFRKVDQYVVWKLQRWLRRKQQRTRRAFRRPSPEWWAAQGLFRCEGTSVRVW